MAHGGGLAKVQEWADSSGVTMSGESRDEVAEALRSIHTESAADLFALTQASPVLLIFLRHFGCAFCRQAIGDVADLKAELAQRRVRPVFVHLGTPERARPFFEYYGIGDVERVSDPEGAVYRLPMFAVPQKNVLWQVVNPVVVWGWFKGAFFKHGVGTIQEDANQMPGLFFLRGSEIVRQFRYRTIADEPDYLKMVR